MEHILGGSMYYMTTNDTSSPKGVDSFYYKHKSMRNRAVAIKATDTHLYRHTIFYQNQDEMGLLSISNVETGACLAYIWKCTTRRGDCLSKRQAATPRGSHAVYETCIIPANYKD